MNANFNRPKLQVHVNLIVVFIRVYLIRGILGRLEIKIPVLSHWFSVAMHQNGQGSHKKIFWWMGQTWPFSRTIAKGLILPLGSGSIMLMLVILIWKFLSKRIMNSLKSFSKCKITFQHYRSSVLIISKTESDSSERCFFREFQHSNRKIQLLLKTYSNTLVKILPHLQLLPEISSSRYALSLDGFVQFLNVFILGKIIQTVWIHSDSTSYSSFFFNRLVRKWRIKSERILRQMNFKNL